MIQGLKRDGVNVEYSDIRRSVGDRFVVEQHVVTLTRPDECADTAAFTSLLG
jgi:hypothetical protein